MSKNSRRIKRFVDDKAKKIVSFKCKFCEFYYEKLNEGGCCTRECLLGYVSQSKDLYDSVYSSFISDTKNSINFTIGPADHRKENETYESFWKRNKILIYLNENSDGAMELTKCLEKARHVKNTESIIIDNTKSNNQSIFSSLSSSPSSSSLFSSYSSIQSKPINNTEFSSFFLQATSSYGEPIKKIKTHNNHSIK